MSRNHTDAEGDVGLIVAVKRLSAAKTRLACWGTFTLSDGDDAFVVEGGYAEP